MRQELRVDNLIICYRKKQVDGRFSCVYFVIDNKFRHNKLMLWRTKFMTNNRRDAWKTDVNLLILIIILEVPVIVNTSKEVTSQIVVVAWEPPLDGACQIDKYTVYYREVIFLELKSKWHSVTVNGNETSCTLQLGCRKEYDVAVTAWSTYTESNLSDSRIWNFKTVGGNVDK